MIDELFFEIIENSEKVFTELSGEDYLRTLTKQYNLSHAAYLGINIPKTQRPEAFIVSTYSPDWVRHYESESYVDIDPVIKRGLEGVMPIDWKNLCTRKKRVRKLFGEADDWGIGRQGLSFPITGRHGETAVFSINSHANDKDWRDLKRRCMRDFQILGFQLHTKVLEKYGVGPETKCRLTSRESEVLKWAAAGKSAWETGEILSIGKSTVRFHLETSRNKLGAINTVQAVATAVRQQLI